MWNGICKEGEGTRQVTETEADTVMYYANVGQTYYIVQGVPGLCIFRIQGDVLDNGQIIIRRRKIYCKERAKRRRVNLPQQWPTKIGDSFTKILDLEEFSSQEKSLLQGLVISAEVIDDEIAKTNLQAAQKLVMYKKLDDYNKKNMQAQKSINEWRRKLRDYVENESAQVIDEHLGDFDDAIVKKDLVYLHSNLPFQWYVVEKAPVLSIAHIKGECIRRDENGNERRIYRADLYDRKNTMESLHTITSLESVMKGGHLFSLEFEDFPLNEENIREAEYNLTLETDFQIVKTEGKKSMEILFAEDPLKNYKL